MKYIIEQTESFANWHSTLRDLRAKSAIARRIERAENGTMATPSLWVVAYLKCGLMWVLAIGFISQFAVA